MDEKNEISILPSDNEKLSHKFIFDSMRKDRQETSEAELEVDTENDVEEEVEETFVESEVSVEFETEIEMDMSPVGDAYDPISLPDGKNYFRIRETSELIGVEPHVLRYWESEFPTVRPMKNASGKRAYSRKDLELFHKIKFLLYQEKFSLKGAKRKLKHWNEEVESKTILLSGPSLETLKTIQNDLKDLIHLLRQDPGGF